MSNKDQVSFALKEVETFELKIDLAIPPAKPVMRGHITVDALPKTKEEVKALADENLEDEAYLRTLVQNVRGLGNAKGEAITGDEAFAEVVSGKFSMYLLPAIIGAYFDHFGQARRKNFLPQRGR